MKIVALSFTILMLVSCGKVANTSSPDSVISADAARWPNPKLVPICFTNKDVVSQEIYRDLLNTAVNEFAKAGVHFRKWRECEAQDYNDSIIRVQFKNVYNWNNSSYSYGGGKSKVGMTRRALNDGNGSTLWIKLDDDYPNQEGRKRDTVIAGTRSAFLHEIGHALGLLHEHTRTDYNPDGGECEAGENHDNIRESAGDIDYIGRPDYDSVMSYCNLKVAKLSQGDIAGIQALYPELKD
ncbi:M12 family metallopeptidase [Oligoflexus tunisiensis]|uniref:M12 family metallopeptidase n=1 Tax=Oligoflexus tunisiensis TaxID=708132 RepID=UPI00114CAE6E|nr:M12 family metallopeptidase [Oligoflexus tunisiensis]